MHVMSLHACTYVQYACVCTYVCMLASIVSSAIIHVHITIFSNLAYKCNLAVGTTVVIFSANLVICNNIFGRMFSVLNFGLNFAKCFASPNECQQIYMCNTANANFQASARKLYVHPHYVHRIISIHT